MSDTYSIKAIILSLLLDRETALCQTVTVLMPIYQSTDVLCILSPKDREHLHQSCLKCYPRVSVAGGDWWYQMSTEFHTKELILIGSKGFS